MIRVTADEPVEILEAHAEWPLVERPDRAGLEGRCIMVLAEPRGGVTIIQQDAADGRLVFRDDTVVAGEARGLLGDHAEAGRVMIAPGNQCGARRRTRRGGVSVIVAQPRLRDAIHRWRRDDAAERDRHAETRVVGHNQQNIWRLLRRNNARRPPRFRLEGIILDHAAKLRIGRRQLFSANGCRGAGRTWRSGGLDLFCLEGSSRHYKNARLDTRENDLS